MPDPLDRLREDLLRGGVAPAIVRRYETELRDHLEAIVEELMLAGVGATAARRSGRAPRPDGSMIDYTVDLPVVAPVGLLVEMQGSGCLPNAANASLALVRQAFADYAAVTVEKNRIAFDADITDGFADCQAAFHADHTVSQRAADYEAVIASLQAEQQLPLVLLGGSEGGLVASIVSTRMGTEAVVLLSSAAGIAFGDLVLSTVSPEGQESVRAGFAQARANPDSSELFAGSSYRFWAGILDLVAADFLVESTVPVLAIQGGRDTSSPVAAARAMADRFAEAGRCNLAYWELAGLDHGMVGPDGRSRMRAVLDAAADWVWGAAGTSSAC